MPAIYDDTKAEWFITEAMTTRDASWFTDNGYEMAEQLEAARAEIGRLNKRSEDWVTLFIYLLGKAVRAHFDGDQPKLEHHVITSAAVALNWWRHLTGAHTAMRPGVAPLDIEAIARVIVEERYLLPVDLDPGIRSMTTQMVREIAARTLELATPPSSSAAAGTPPPPVPR